ncbi:hypothetical protein DFS33DRAFT_1384472 [Desarmillaria ectypa]|nr:hypothetical protein DFS33DRAFT_1384472 [Desarmillaria ectypa]
MIFEAFTEPITIEYAKPVYHSWGNWGSLGNSQYEAAGKKTADEADNLPMHEFLSNGLLEVDPEGPHPIYQLIEFPEKKWETRRWSNMNAGLNELPLVDSISGGNTLRSTTFSFPTRRQSSRGNESLPTSHFLREHGQFLPYGKGPVPSRHILPSFAYSQTLLHHDITIAHTASWLGELSDEEIIAWEKKTDDRLQWRGRTTGTPLIWDIEWRFSHRIRMMDWVEKGMDGNVTILAPPGSRKEQVGKDELVQKAKYGPAMLDMAFSDDPVQCDPDVDGNVWSGRLKWLLSFHALNFKSTVYPERFTDRLMPWVHYIPIHVDYSDLRDILVFFHDDLKGDNNHQDLARKIASAGRDWSRTFWRKEDMTAYNHRVFLEYAQIMSTACAAMSYNHWEKSG